LHQVGLAFLPNVLAWPVEDDANVSRFPATGTAEPGGWTTRELLSIIDSLAGLKVIGADVVEVAPVYDNVGETTSLAAAEIVQSLLYLMLKSPFS